MPGGSHAALPKGHEGSGSEHQGSYRNLRTRLGSPKAIKAMARYLACIIYRLFTKGQAWVDRGAEQYDKNRQTRDLAKLQTQANARGFRLVPVTEQTA